MCLKTNVPNIPKPQPLQEAKTPDTVNPDRQKRRTPGGMTGGTLLTGPMGAGSASTGRATLLGQ